jgi:NCAIR mutase (PurE)-related protein
VTGAPFVLDFERFGRIGLDEAIFCAGKTIEQLDAILDACSERDRGLLLTRLWPEPASRLASRHRERLDYDPDSRTGIFLRPHPPRPSLDVAVVCAGTSDLPVAREAFRTLAYYGQASRSFADVGVAGLWRLMQQIEEIRACPVVIVAAGMDAALPSVVGGLVPGLVVAVPTSVGYGVAAGGRPALESALASCAPGVVVVNIDNGYGAACAALRALQAARASGG